jgi:hypothetical protein
MTDIKKAMAFARECLKWKTPELYQPEDAHGLLIIGEELGFKFDLASWFDVQSVLEQFLGKRFFIQINRGTSSLFKWTALVGIQNRAGGPLIFDHGRGDSDDMLDAIFDACVAAIRLYPDSEAIKPNYPKECSH